MPFWHRLSLVRVPLLFWLIFGLGLIAAMQPSMSLSRGFADVTPMQFFLAAIALWSATAALAASANLALLYGPARIGTIEATSVRSDIVALVCMLATAAPIAYVAHVAPTLDPAHRDAWTYVWLALIAWGIVVTAALVLVWIALRLTDPRSGFANAVELILPLRWVPGARAAYEAPSPTAELRREAATRLHGILQWLGPGYVDPQTGRLLGGHILAAFLALGYGVLYWIAGRTVIVHSTRGTEQSGLASTLLFVTVILTLGVWIGSAAAFFLDRYRIPLLSPIVLALVVMSFMNRPDHYFPVRHVAHAPARPTPAETILASRTGDRIVLIESAGGGIQAAAWTTTLMARMQQQHPRFRDMVRLVSGVSGGSVGLYYSLRMYDDAPGPRIALNELAKLGGESMLEAVAHGLAYPGRFDRGLALESLMGNIAANPWSLGDYAAKMREKPGALPAVILNATSVEDGAPVAFSTTTMEAVGTGILDWSRADDNTRRDVRLATAARMSATFPYVTPSPRARGGKPSARHFGDGGYFDNFGQYAAMAWLEDALQTLPAERLAKLEVMLVSIESFPEDDTPELQPEGRVWQLIAPMSLLYNARTYSQRNRNALELALFRTRFASIYGLKPEQFRTVGVRYHVSPGCEANPPLSWHLAPRERACVAASWDASQQDLAPVAAFVEGR